MKRTFLSIAIVLAAVVAGGATAYTVSRFAADPTTQSNHAESKGLESKPNKDLFAPTVGSKFTSYSDSKYPDLTYAAENAVQAVVGVEVVQRIEVSRRSSSQYDPFLEFFGIPQQGGRSGEPSYREQRGGGSGVIISEDGYIITNNHVVDGASTLRVKLYDGGTYDAEIIGTDPTTDIALIKIEKDDLPTVPFGSSDDLRLGEWVLAIGSPFDLQSTITAGIVSAKARQLDVIPSDFRIESFIQTDAVVNPGNSGGALVNVRGELIGINTLIKSQTGSYIGYSFAVPESIVRKVATDLREFGVVQRALLGVQFITVTEELLEAQGKELGLTEVGGAYVASVVEDGAASEAGIRKGDVIISVDDIELGTKVNMQTLIAKHRPGDKVKIGVKRDGKVKHFVVTLRNNSGKAELVTREQTDIAELLGGRLVDASQSLCRELDLKGGIEVKSVSADGLLGRARVRSGFVITHINDKQILTLADLRRIGGGIVTSIDGVYPNGKSASYHFVE